MTSTQLSTGSSRRWQTLALVVGLVALALGVVGIFLGGGTRFFQSYLFAWLFWFGISIGSLAILFLHFISGSRWGLSVRRIAEAAALAVLPMAVLFLPILLGLPAIFPWTDPAYMQQSALLAHKVPYLNVPFFIVRAVIYFVIWGALALTVTRQVSRLAQDPTNLAVRGRLQGLGALGLILLVLTVTFASVDWILSLHPEWNSTVIGLLTLAGQVLTALAFAILALNLLPDFSLGSRWTYRTTPIPYKDLGALLLTFVMGYAYLAYFQFMIIWAANIPREVTWYIDRSQGGWQVVIAAVALLQFILPFLILLSVRARHSLRVLALLGGLIFVSYLFNVYWMVMPAFSPSALSPHWLDLVLPVALGGLWLASFLFFLARRPVLSAAEQHQLEPVVETAIP